MSPAWRCSSAVKQHRLLDSGRAGRADQGQPEADAGAVVSGNFWLEFPGFHDPKNPFHDKRVREAISLAIDRDAVNEAESAGYGMVDGNWINDDVQYALTWPKRSSARSIVAKMAVMYAGKIVEQGAVRDLFRSPQHPYTQALLGSMPKLGSKEPLYAIPGHPPDLAQLPSGCAFYPRCPHAMPQCVSQELLDRRVGPNWTARC
jgi:oligopeptide/dipeptide ABC transporter ATP-binding protein